jgi:hypothetical protein
MIYIIFGDNMENIKQFSMSIAIELILIIVGVISGLLMPLCFQISQDVSYSISAFIVLLSITAISIKFSTYKLLTKQVKDFSASIALANTLTQKIARMKSPNINYAGKFLNDIHKQIDKVEKGIIYLSEGEYFNSIIKESKNLSENDTVFAVNVFDELRFKEDPRQINYFKSNIKAINDNSINFKRVFIIDTNLIQNPNDNRISVIKNNIEKGIEVKVVNKSELSGRNDLLIDWVLFKNSKKQKLYIDYQDKVDKTRVSYGELIIDKTTISKYGDKFLELEYHAFSQKEMEDFLKN